MNGDQREAVWRGLLDADQSSRYWRAMTLRFVRQERIAKIFLAVVSSATVASWGFWREISIVWQGLSITAALVSVALPIFDVPRHVESMVELYERWCSLLKDYEEIWTDRASISDADVQQSLKALRKQEVELAKKAVKLPHDNAALGAKSFYDVLRERSIPIPEDAGETA